MINGETCLTEDTTFYAVWQSESRTQSEEELDNVLSLVKQLETLAKEFLPSGSTKKQIANLALSYIRSNRYNSSKWSVVAGKLNAQFNESASQNNTFTNLQNIALLTLTKTGEKSDFVHMCAALNAGTNSGAAALALASWGGDLCQIINDYSARNIPASTALNQIKIELENDSGYFGEYDLAADINANNLAYLLNNNNLSITHAMLINSENQNPFETFITNTFGENLTLEEFKTKVYSAFDSNLMITLLLNEYGVDKKTNSSLIRACLDGFCEVVFDKKG